MIEQYQKLQKEKRDIIKKINTFLKKSKKSLLRDFHSLFTDIFDKYPTLEGISFRAFTPYFNDGERCYFRSYHEEPDFNFTDDEEDEACIDEVCKIMKKFDDDVIEDLFGDHVEVSITKKEISVGDYSYHD